MQSLRILIVGGGIAGLTLATALRRRGLGAELVERAARWNPIGAGIAVQPNAMRVLRELGLGSAVEHAGTRVRRWLFCDRAGQVLCDIALDPLWGDVSPFVGIARAKLHEALLSWAPTCRIDTAVTSLRQDDRGVSVAFSDSDVGEYDLVIGADGLYSTVRAGIFGPDEPVYGGQMVWRSLVSLPSQSLFDAVQFWLGDGCFFGMCPVGSDLVYGFGNVTGPRLHDPVEGRLRRLRRRFSEFGPLVQEYLHGVEHDDQVHCAPIEWLAQERWYRERVVLIGDAAHASSPMMGQGGSMAMEDALVFAETLDTAPDLPSAVAAFVDRRQPRVGWVRQQSETVGEMLRLPPPVRDTALRERGQTAFCDRFAPLIVPA